MPLTLLQTCDAIRRKELSSREAVKASLDQIATNDLRLHAVLESHTEAAIERASHIDERLAKNDAPGALAGVPVLIKDNICGIL